ncbi:hypothetical protein QOL99_00335 [Deinococcus sp. MIMF12]|uniref:Uncharacterized protein n=1 Tax=Deinococcus rhizophilus TaxID=3049544 RepID=A0ABT7JCB6_9DEIO|nr:hypothetical protein [Deinococcus rhizophilus]MDL2342596.1 hypothetical protein [Deinococcus rhizophilus]
MPATEAAPLTDVLTEMFAAAAAGQVARRTVSRGLHLRAVVRESGRRELLLWRTASRLPSATECKVVARDAGFVEPVFKAWPVEGVDGFHLRDRADWQHPCTHDWGETVFISGRQEGGTSRTCRRCGTTASTIHKRRGKGTTYLYNEHEVSEAAYLAATASGPMPSTLDREARAALMAEVAQVPVATTDRLALRGEVCGLCRHGKPEWDGMIACTLGWEAHDNVWRELPRKQWEAVQMGHPGVPLPLLTPHCRCMATGGRWLPRVVAA